MAKPIVILGVFVADTTYRAARQPRMGETLLGDGFALGPGGKGSNQAVAAARLGGDVTFISKLGDDPFADMAARQWAEAGVRSAVARDPESYTGAAYIFVDTASGDNAIIVCPGAALTISPADIEAKADLIQSAGVFVTQLEQPVAAARAGLHLAKQAGARTILNPAPAPETELDPAIFPLCDFATPNETEAEGLTGIKVTDAESARAAADQLLAKGVGTAIITLGAAGALIHDSTRSELISAYNAGPVVETTGAGDAFNGGLAVALADGLDPTPATRFANATAAISVTRPGTAPSMPTRAEVEAVLRG